MPQRERRIGPKGDSATIDRPRGQGRGGRGQGRGLGQGRGRGFGMGDMWRWMLLQQLFGGDDEGGGNEGTIYEDDVNYYGTPGEGQYIGDPSSMQGVPAQPSGSISDPAMTSQLDWPEVPPEGSYSAWTAAGGAPDLVAGNLVANAPEGKRGMEDILGTPPPPQPTSGKLGIPQAYETFRQAGFGDEQARLMTAIAMGESGLNPMAHNPNAATGDNSYGLTQVNMLGKLGPARMQEYGLKSNEDLFDPLTNAKAAFGISGGGKNFSPWSVYKKGAHQQYLDDVAAALAGNKYADPALTKQLESPPPDAPTQPTKPEEDEEDDD